MARNFLICFPASDVNVELYLTEQLIISMIAVASTYHQRKFKHQHHTGKTTFCSTIYSWGIKRSKSCVVSLFHQPSLGS
jgi:hypothetical protein